MAEDTPFVRGAARLSRRIATIRENLALPKLTQEIGALLLRRTLQRFDRQVTPDNVPWPDLKEATTAAKRRLGYGKGAILVRTGDLRNSIKLIRGGEGATYTTTGAGVRIGIADSEIAEYGKAHNLGLGGMPVRRFLGVGRLDIKAIDSLMRRKAKKLEAIV